MSDPETIRATVDAYVATMSAADKDAWLALFNDDPSVEDPVGTPVHQGREAVAGFWDLTHGLADSIRLERTGPVRVVGSEAAWPMQAISEIGGQHFVVDIIDVMTFDDDGRIASLRAFWDATELRPV